jgi:hypothetical protein
MSSTFSLTDRARGCKQANVGGRYVAGRPPAIIRQAWPFQVKYLLCKHHHVLIYEG